MITVIIPTKNEEKNLPELLRSLENQTYHEKFETLVVDGKSKDKTQNIAKEHGCRVVIQERTGISNARNLGWKKARGNVLVFIEADTVLNKNFLKEIENEFKNKNVKCARPNIIPVRENWIQKALAAQIELSGSRQNAWEFPTIFRKEILRKTGGWDEEIDFAEDRELPARIKKAGYKSKAIKKAVIYVKPVDSLWSLFKQGRWYGRNIFGYFKKTRDFVTLGGVLIYSSLVPLFFLSFINTLFLIFFGMDLAVLFLYSGKGYVKTRNIYSFLIIPISFVRGFGEFLGIIESFFKKGGGKL